MINVLLKLKKYILPLKTNSHIVQYVRAQSNLESNFSNEHRYNI